MRSSESNKQGLDAWFMRDVLPSEPALLRFLRRNWRTPHEVPDLLQEVYARVYEAARRERPAYVKSFVFTAARNLMIDRVRQMNIVSIEAVADFEHLNVTDDVPSLEEFVSA